MVATKSEIGCKNVRRQRRISLFAPAAACDRRPNALKLFRSRFLPLAEGRLESRPTDFFHFGRRDQRSFARLGLERAQIVREKTRNPLVIEESSPHHVTLGS